MADPKGQQPDRDDDDMTEGRHADERIRGVGDTDEEFDDTEDNDEEEDDEEEEGSF